MAIMGRWIASILWTLLVVKVSATQKNGTSKLSEVIQSYIVSQELNLVPAVKFLEILEGLRDFPKTIHLSRREVKELVGDDTTNPLLRRALKRGADVNCLTIGQLAELPAPRASDIISYTVQQGVSPSAAGALVRCCSYGCTGPRRERRKAERKLAVLALGVDVRRYADFISNYLSVENLVPKAPKRRRRKPRRSRRKRRRGRSPPSGDPCDCPGGRRLLQHEVRLGRELQQTEDEDEDTCLLDAEDGMQECVAAGTRLGPTVIPIVFHVFGYPEGNLLLPPRVQTDEPFESLVDNVNTIFADADSYIQFTLAEVRRFTDPDYPYLLLDSVESYQDQYLLENMLPLATEHDVDRLTHFNVYVAGDARLPVMSEQITAAYTFITRPGIETFNQGFPCVLNFDHVDPAGGNNADQYFAGSRTFAHELGHACSLLHPFTGGCERDGDCVADTPQAAGTVLQQPFGKEAADFCLQNKLVPSKIPTFYDSCDGDEGPDPVINVMHYTFPQCQRHLTPGQVLRMECALRQWRPTMSEANAVARLPRANKIEESLPGFTQRPFVFSKFC